LHRFDVQHTLRYIGGLFAALTHVHACGVVHRDVKPSNALYSFERREMLLVDFGLAERMRERSNRVLRAAARLSADELEPRESALSRAGVIGAGRQLRRLRGHMRTAQHNTPREQQRCGSPE